MANIYTYNYWGVADWHANVMFKLRPMPVLNPIFPSTTMDQESLFRCHDCHHRKPKDQLALCKRTDKYGATGSPSLPGACPVQNRSDIDMKTRN